jgi:hypothetical protein
MAPATPGRAAVPPAPTPIGEGPTRQGKCCASSSRARGAGSAAAQQPAPSRSTNSSNSRSTALPYPPVLSPAGRQGRSRRLRWCCQSAQAALRPHMLARLCERQGNLAREPSVAPIKAHLTPELACNYVLHNAPAESAARGRRDWRPARLDPAQTEPFVRRPGPGGFNTTARCGQRAVFCRVGRALLSAVIALAVATMTVWETVIGAKWIAGLW